jgi:hypothetical protein
MNRRLSGPDSSLNAPLRSDSESEWQDWLQDDAQVSQETVVAENEERTIRMGLLEEAMQELSDRERHILTERRLQDEPDHAGGARVAVRRQPRARASDRGPRLREAAEGDARRRGRAEPGRGVNGRHPGQREALIGEQRAGVQRARWVSRPAVVSIAPRYPPGARGCRSDKPWS